MGIHIDFDTTQLKFPLDIYFSLLLSFGVLVQSVFT